MRHSKNSLENIKGQSWGANSIPPSSSWKPTGQHCPSHSRTSLQWEPCASTDFCTIWRGQLVSRLQKHQLSPWDTEKTISVCSVAQTQSVPGLFCAAVSHFSVTLLLCLFFCPHPDLNHHTLDSKVGWTGRLDHSWPCPVHPALTSLEAPMQLPCPSQLPKYPNLGRSRNTHWQSRKELYARNSSPKHLT